MSSIYSSNNGVPLCQRCNVPLAVSTLQCANCGYYNTVLPDGGTQQQNQQSPMWNQLPGQSLYHEQQANQSRQRQDGGLLKRYPAQVEQRNRYPSPSSQPEGVSQPFSSQLPMNGVSSQVSQQPEIVPTVAHSPQISGNRSGYTGQSSLASPNRGYPSNGIQPIPPISTGPSMPPMRLNTSFDQVSPSAYTQVPYSFGKEPVKSQQLNVGRIVGVLLLLLALIGGSFLAYAFLFAHKSTQQVTNSSSSSPLIVTRSVPQGTPLFQDNFIQNTNGWSIQSYPGEFSVTLGNGALKLASENNKLLWEQVPGGKSYGDFQLSVDAVLSKGSQDNGYGVYIRGTLSQNTSIISFYRFELYGDGSFAVFKGMTDANGTITASRLVDYTNSSLIQKQGILNHVMINAKGSRLQFIVNGQTVSTVSDTTYMNGSVALFVSNLQNASPGAEATFSHLTIYPATS